MKKLVTITVIGMFAASGAAIAEEGLKSAGYGGCGYGAALKTATVAPVITPVITPVPIKTASETATTTKSGG